MVGITEITVNNKNLSNGNLGEGLTVDEATGTVDEATGMVDFLGKSITKGTVNNKNLSNIYQ